MGKTSNEQDDYSHFNWRVMAHTDILSDNGVYLMIHEVYYNNDIPTTYSIDGASVGGENLDDLKKCLEYHKEALNKPILWYGDKFPQEYKF